MTPWLRPELHPSRWPARGAVLALLLGCGGGSDSVVSAPVDAGNHPSSDYSSQAAVASLGQRVLGVYEQFASNASTLEQATFAYAESGEASERLEAQQAWAAAMNIWQQAEVFRFGPAGDTTNPGGLGIADEIYSWVVSTNTCRVDQETASEASQDAELIALEAINVRGLDSLEYLLFNEDLGNTCASNLSLNTSGAWAGIEGEVESRRARYAHSLAVGVEERATALVQAWQQDAGDFLSTLGRKGSEYSTVGEAFSAIGAGLLYLDVQTKDRKVGGPAGLLACSSATCPDDLESPFARVSKQNVAANLLAFELLLSSSEESSEATRWGFADALKDVGAAELAEQMKVDVEQALQAVEDIGEPTLLKALDDDLDAVVALYDAIKKLTDNIKGEFIEELGLQISEPGAGDAD